MTTSKWEQIEGQSEVFCEEDDVDGKPLDSSPVPTVSSTTSSKEDTRGLHFLNQLHNELNEERRALLREVELKVLQYQDEIESGKRTRKPGISLEKQVEEYRKELIRYEYMKSKSNNGSDGGSNSSKNRSLSSSSSLKQSSKSDSTRKSSTRSRSPRSPVSSRDTNR